MSIAKKLSGVARGPADVSWDLDFAYYSGGSEGDGSLGGIASTGLVDTSTTSLSAIYVTNDGNYIYKASAGSVVTRYSMSEPYHADTASIDTGNTASSVASGVYGITVANGGTRMYLGTNTTSIAVEQFNLSTPYDLTTATRIGALTNANVGIVTGSGRGNAISSDGTKLFVCANGDNKIFELTLSTPWEISSYSVTASVTVTTDFGMSGLGTGIDISPDDTKLYIHDGTNAHLLVFATPADLSTAYYAGSESVGTNPDNNLSVAGDFLYSADNGVGITQYSLNNRGIEGLDGAAYTGKSFSVTTQAPNPYAVFLKSDGTKLYQLNSSPDAIFQYTLSTPWDVSTASYDSVSFSITQSTVPTGLYIKPDGTKFFVIGNTNETVYQYSMSTAWDLSTASYDSVSFSVATQATSPTNITFKPDGTVMYIGDTSSDFIYQYSLSTAWDLSTATYASKSMDTVGASQRSVSVSSNGEVLIALDNTDNKFYQYRLTTPWDLSTGIYTGVEFSVSAQDTTLASATITNGFIYLVGTTNDTIYQYVLGGVDAEDLSPVGVGYNNDGTKLFISGVNSDVINEFALSTPYDTSTASLTVSQSITTNTPTPRGFSFSADGTKIAVADGNNVDYYTLSTAFDASTLTYASTYARGSACYQVSYNSDGTKLFISVSRTIERYSLSTAYDVSTATSDSNTLDTTALGGIAPYFYLSDDGKRLFVNQLSTVHEYSLSTAYDLSTAVLGKSFSVTLAAVNVGIHFKPDGTGFVGASTVTSDIHQYTIGIQE